MALAIPVQILFGGRWPRGGDPSPRSVFVSSSPSEPITAAPRHALYFAKLRFLPRQTQHGYALDNQVYDWESRGRKRAPLSKRVPWNERGFDERFVVGWIVISFLFFFARFEFLIKS